jgi:hypothetical protein
MEAAICQPAQITVAAQGDGETQDGALVQARSRGKLCEGERPVPFPEDREQRQRTIDRLDATLRATAVHRSPHRHSLDGGRSVRSDGQNTILL